ncbi:hypothetical protein [Ekhidna sp.]|uniref:hypothetical protein n=1 Tax=Ekhidna sp. TaxID=2608089 RepID=UPI003CCBF22D
MATVLKYFTVYFLSGLKFVFGPTFGVANGLPTIATIILTSLGMMTTIYLFTFFGDEIRGFFSRFRKKKRRVFTKRNRRFVMLWKKFGLKGICLLTPLILTPPGGGLLINLISSKKNLILKWMWISAILWSVIITLLIKHAFWLVEDFIPT